MANKFLCGRLIINKNGVVKKLLLEQGGGTRDCTISHIDMGFEEIHDRLREIYLLDQPNCNSKLYDFQRRELDTKRYSTFYDYVQKNGLKFKGTLLYLCTPADGDDTVSPISPEKRRTTTQPIQNPSPVIRRIPQVEADSSTPLIVIKTDHSPQSTNEPAVNNRITEDPRTSSFSNYSFEKSLNEFIDYLRLLIGQYNRESILIQLFEYLCTIRGLSSIILDRLKQQIHSVNEHQKSIYNEGLDKIEKLSRSIKALIELNKMKFSHLDQHSIIINSFNQFHQNFNILRDQWVNNKTTHRHSTSYSSTNYSMDPASSTSFSSSSSRHLSERDSRKRTYPSSRSPHRSSSSYRKSTEDDNNEKYSLFKNLLNSLAHLLDILYQRRFTSFYYLVESLIGETKACRSSIKLSDHRSLYDAEQIIISIEGRLTKRINDEYHHASPHGINRDLEYSFNKTLDSIRDLLTSFDHYRSQIDKHKRSRTTHHRSSSTEEKPIIKNSHQQQARIDDDDDDQSSEASHSSVGDEVLMEVARDAYEQRPKQYK